MTVPGRKGQYPESASADLAKAERALADAADQAAAYRAVLACDGRLSTEGKVPAIGCSQFGPALAARPDHLKWAPLSVTMSAAGDLAFTYGDAAWTKAGAAQRGHYARIWQRRAGGWKLIFDELVAV